ncbi:MAG TPA: dTMP kinase [Syntrophales bacterium]|nr:dTMP kinase [Syntrophales bacterium]
MAGRFITFEGVEGSGKSTQIRLAGEFLQALGLTVVVTQEPGGTPLGERIREILLNRGGFDISGEAEVFLFAAARAQHADAVIRPALESGKIVLCDRFSDATIAYQAYGRGLPLESVREICRLASRGLSPHLTLLFDLPVEEGLARALQRIAGREGNTREDRFEREHLDFHRRIREGYLAVARQEPGRVRILDASKDIESTRQEVRSILSAFLGG